MLGALWTVGLMGLTGEKMNIITTVLPTLVLVIGFTDAVHLMIDIRRERAAACRRFAPRPTRCGISAWRASLRRDDGRRFRLVGHGAD